MASEENYEFRSVRPAELVSLWALLDRVFPHVGGMGEAFPLYLGEDNCRYLYGAFRDGELVGHVGTNRRGIVSGSHRFTGACIGAVAVDEAARGERLASRMLAWTYDRLIDDGVHLAYISGDRDLYRRSGAVSYGRTARYVLDDLKGGNDGRSWSPESDLSICASLYGHEDIRFEREDDDWKQLAKQQKTFEGDADVVLAGDKAYIIVHAPQGAWRVLEYAGDRGAVLDACAFWLRQHDGESLAIDVPVMDEALTQLLGERGLLSDEEVVEGTVRVIDFAKFASDFPGLCEGGDPAEIGHVLFTATEGTAFVPLPRYGLNYF